MCCAAARRVGIHCAGESGCATSAETCRGDHLKGCAAARHYRRSQHAVDPPANATDFASTDFGLLW
jgi:hypothetical protein